MDRAEAAAQTLRAFQARTDDFKVRDWQLSLADSETLSIGLKDREVGGVYAPPKNRRALSGQLYLVWADGQVSVSALNALFLRKLEAALKRMRASAYKEEFVIDMPEDQAPPEVRVFDPDIRALLTERSDRFFEDLASFEDRLDAARESFDGQVGAGLSRLRVMNSRGLDRAVSSSSHSFGAYADSVFGVGYRHRKELPAGALGSRLDFLNRWLPRFQTEASAPAAGERPVILMPGVAASFLGHFVLRNLNGEAIANKSSAWGPADFESKKSVFGDDLTIRYDPTVDWLSRSYQMDARGLMAEPKVFVEGGKLSSPVVSLKAARQLSCLPSPVPSSSGLSIEAGRRAELEAAIAELDDAVIVPSVLGMHTQDAVRGNYSLSVPNALIVKDGAITGQVKATIAGSFFEDLRSEITVLDDPLEDMPGLAIRTKVDF